MEQRGECHAGQRGTAQQICGSHGGEREAVCGGDGCGDSLRFAELYGDGESGELDGDGRNLRHGADHGKSDTGFHGWRNVYLFGGEYFSERYLLDTRNGYWRFGIAYVDDYGWGDGGGAVVAAHGSVGGWPVRVVLPFDWADFGGLSVDRVAAEEGASFCG